MVYVHIVTVKKLYENIWICRDDGSTLDYFHKLDHFKSLTDGDGLSSVAEKLFAVQGPDLVNPYPADIQGIPTPHPLKSPPFRPLFFGMNSETFFC